MSLQCSPMNSTLFVYPPCRPPSGLHNVSTTSRERKYAGAPSLDEVLPDIIPQIASIRQLLDEVLDSILPQPEEVWSGYRVRVLSVANGVCLLDDARPGASRGAGNDGAIGTVCRYDLELRPIAAVKDGAMVNDFGVRVNRGKISSARTSVADLGE